MSCCCASSGGRLWGGRTARGGRELAPARHARRQHEANEFRSAFEAEKKRRIRWESTTGMVVTNDQRTLTRCGGSWEKTWAVGSLLPTTGKFSWRVRIDRNLANEGVMCIGIATECGHAFGLSPYSGRLSSLYRPSPGCKIEANSDPPEELQHCSFTAQLHVDSCGSPTNLKGRANGAIVEIIVDADAGTVQFRLTRNCTVPGSSYTIINRSPVVTAISGLPRGVQLRRTHLGMSTKLAS